MGVGFKRYIVMIPNRHNLYVLSKTWFSSKEGTLRDGEGVSSKTLIGM